MDLLESPIDLYALHSNPPKQPMPSHGHLPASCSSSLLIPPLPPAAGFTHHTPASTLLAANQWGNVREAPEVEVAHFPQAPVVPAAVLVVPSSQWSVGSTDEPTSTQAGVEVGFTAALAPVASLQSQQWHYKNAAALFGSSAESPSPSYSLAAGVMNTPQPAEISEIALLETQLMRDFGDKAALAELRESYLSSERKYQADLLQQGASALASSE